MSTLESKEQQAIREVLDYAESHPYGLDLLRKLCSPGPKEGLVAGDNPSYTCHIGDCRVVYSVEEQVSGWYAHISVSKPDRRPQLPSPEEVEPLLAKFGCKGGLRACARIWIEDGFSVNILQRRAPPAPSAKGA